MKTYAISDLHGCFDIYEQVSAFLGPNDKVFCLGDCTDRGPEPWRTLRAVIKDKRFEYLLGNHEDMLLQALTDTFSDYTDDTYGQLYKNGGKQTHDECLTDPEVVGIFRYMQHFPTKHLYKNANGVDVYLSHSGLYSPLCENPNAHDLMWSRGHFANEMPEGKYVVVHGHTPIQYMSQMFLKKSPYAPVGVVPPNFFEKISAETDMPALIYANGHKINIDLGTYKSGRSVLLDLDTFEQFIFTCKV
ncbi:MAG: metallophosphoesterase [Salinivirgaceae bacterium]|nr:metallophosphoesterase [Salinivirgaceae bacterium]